MKIALAVAATLLALPVQAQQCRATLGQPVLAVAEDAASLDCAVAGELDSVAVRLPGRICNADFAAQKNALAGSLGAWLRNELVLSGSLSGRAAKIRSLLQGDPDNETFLKRVLDRASLSVKGLAAADEVRLTQAFATRETVRVAAGDCYSHAALLAYAGSLRAALQSFLATLEAFWIKAPCDSPEALLPATQSHGFVWGNTTTFDAVSPAQVVQYASPQYQADLCAAPGAQSYQWSLAFGSSSDFEIVGASNGPRVTVKAKEEAVRAARQRQTRLPDLVLALDALLDANLPGIGGQRSAVGSHMLTKFGKVNAPAYPTLGRYWIDDYRLGTGIGTLQNIGILDHGLTWDGDESDGIVYIEGTNFGADARFRVSDRPMQILERSEQGGVQRVKAQTSEVKHVYISIWRPDDPMWLPLTGHTVRALGPAFLDRELVQGTIGVIQVNAGAPLGKLQTRVGDKTSQSELPQLETSGVRLNIQDLNSQRYSLAFAEGPGQNQVTLRITLPFESDGDEMTGTYEPTLVYWVCQTVRVSKDQCPAGGIGCLLEAVGSAIDSLPSCRSRSNWSEERHAVEGGEASRKPLRVQIDGFSIEAEAVLGISSGKLALAQSAAVRTSGTYSLSTDATDLPKPSNELQAAIRDAVDGALSGNQALRQALLDAVDQLNTRFATLHRIFALKANSEVIFMDREAR